ncbi:latent-transforming growth factor beta-binding protein 1-like [Osmerus mordax]|uniref:latent-transforming growth factor beta-binding protein 1-like n=1 Tax=Osmerus mordax TaxID=8014 RepID=UPI00350F4508
MDIGICSCQSDKTWLFTGAAKFKEICAGGMGYTVLPKPPNRIQPDANRPVREHVITPQEPVVQRLPFPEKPTEALSVTQRQLPSVPD